MSTQPRFGSAMILFAHPDDAEYMCGGTVARWAREGTQVHYVVATDGSAGSNEPGVTREQMRPIREREQRAAAEVLGVASVMFLGEVDGELEVTLDTRRKVCREVRRLRPDVIVAPDPQRLWSGTGYINHSDHKAAGALALTAVMPDAPTRLMFPELLEEGLEPFEIPALWLVTMEPDTYVDITETIDVKIQALARHESQGAAESEPWVLLRAKETAAEAGAEAGMEYAESFRAFSFTDDDESPLDED
ncbi:MAG: PIG-L family deacetylase [Actinomycetota bacterium]|nr:PIG-L family deacetylase [Actinomycetota bacterium]